MRTAALRPSRAELRPLTPPPSSAQLLPRCVRSAAMFAALAHASSFAHEPQRLEML